MRKRTAIGAGGLLLLISVTLGCAGNRIPVDSTPEEILAHAEAKLAARKYFDAAETLEHFLRTYPGTAKAPLAKLRLGDARFGLEEYVLARAEYLDVVEDYPASPWVEEARFQITRCSFASVLPYNLDQTETVRAIELLTDFRRDYPKSRFLPQVEEMTSECRERLARGEYEAGRFYERQRRYRSAKIQYEYVVEEFPETRWACRARLHLGEIHRIKNKIQDARAWYLRVPDDCPESDEARLAEEALNQLADGGGT